MMSSFKTDSKRFLHLIFKSLLLIFICVAISFAIIYPLWLFANKNSKGFSIFVICVFIAFFSYKIIRKIIMYIESENPDKIEKTKRIRRLLKNLVLAVILLITFVFFVLFVINGHRLLAIVPLFLGFSFSVLLQKK